MWKMDVYHGAATHLMTLFLTFGLETGAVFRNKSQIRFLYGPLSIMTNAVAVFVVLFLRILYVFYCSRFDVRFLFPKYIVFANKNIMHTHTHTLLRDGFILNWNLNIDRFVVC